MCQEYNLSYINVNNLSCFTENNLSCINICMNYGERLKCARKFANLTQKLLAEALGVSQANISKLEIGAATGSEFTVQLADACRVSPRWLATGEGEMLVEVYNLTTQQRKVLTAMQNMSIYEIDTLIKISHSLAEQEKPNGTEK